MLEDLSGREILEQFKSNKKLKITTYIVGGLVVLVGGYFAYQQFVFKPKNDESKDVYYEALNYAAVDSSSVAIPKLKNHVKEYDGYIGGEVSQFVLARQLMNEKKYDEAIKELEGVDVDDTYLSIGRVLLIGDCLSQQKKYKEAGDKYLEAAEINPNDALTPLCLFKAGGCAEAKKDYKTALTCYQRIKDDYGQTQIGFNIDKYIGRVEGK